MKNNTVYVVTWDNFDAEYTETGILGVFSSEEKAEEAITEELKLRRYFDRANYQIIDTKLDDVW